MHGLQKRNAALHAVCPAKDAAGVKSLVDLNKLPVERAAQKKKTVELIGRLSE